MAKESFSTYFRSQMGKKDYIEGQYKVACLLDDLKHFNRNYLIMVHPRFGKSTMSDLLCKYYKENSKYGAQILSYRAMPYEEVNRKYWKDFDPNHIPVDLIIFDDPVRNEDESNDLDKMKSLLNYVENIPSDIPIVCFVTRFTNGDFAGQILNHSTKAWTFLRVQPPELTQIKNTIGRRKWQSLYMQQPIAENLM